MARIGVLCDLADQQFAVFQAAFFKEPAKLGQLGPLYGDLRRLTAVALHPILTLAPSEGDLLSEQPHEHMVRSIGMHDV